MVETSLSQTHMSCKPFGVALGVDVYYRGERS